MYDPEQSESVEQVVDGAAVVNGGIVLIGSLESTHCPLTHSADGFRVVHSLVIVHGVVHIQLPSVNWIRSCKHRQTPTLS